jgi:hypothetical protein
MRRQAKAFAKVIAACSPRVQDRLTELRKLVLEAAKSTPGVGPVVEELRWGQHSFLTSETGSGSTIRIDQWSREPETCAMFFHCQSGLVRTFKDLYGPTFRYEGERALLFRAGDHLPIAQLHHCISLALTHHLRKKSPGSSRRGAGGRVGKAV